MNKITITIDEIKSNPNLNLKERINKYANDGSWSAEELESLAIASIKQEYEYWANTRTNISSRTNDMLVQILNGHILNKVEEYEMICDEPEKVELYSKYEVLKQKIKDNSGITTEDFEQLCNSIGLDLETTALIKSQFENNGLIIESYAEESSHQK